nr:MAG TPA: hypothetical protein [Caudoviricetes sp.]
MVHLLPIPRRVSLQMFYNRKLLTSRHSTNVTCHLLQQCMHFS